MIVTFVICSFISSMSSPIRERTFMVGWRKCLPALPLSAGVRRSSEYSKSTIETLEHFRLPSLFFLSLSLFGKKILDTTIAPQRTIMQRMNM